MGTAHRLLSKVAATILLAGCALWMPASKTAVGTITRVDHDQRYEAVCPLAARLHDPNVCDAPPVCCSYHIAVAQADGTVVRFWGFWPKYAEGLKEGESGTFHLHRTEIIRFPCTMYGCAGRDVDYAVLGDSDVTH